MEKKIIALLLIMLAIGFLIGAVGGYGATSSQASDLRRQISDLQNQVDDLEGQISQKDSEISSLHTKITGLQQLQILGVYFSPDGGCENQIRYWIGRANSTIHILIYSFTLDPIGDSIITAYQRGIEIKIVFEKQQITQYSEYQRLKAIGVAVRNDTNSDLMHDKVMIIDGNIVLTGSFNYSAAAEQDNNENLIIIKSIDVAIIYEQEFQKIWNQSI